MGEPIPALVRCPDWCELGAGHEYVRTETSPDPWRVHTSTTTIRELAVVVTQQEILVLGAPLVERPKVTVAGALHTGSPDTMTEVVRAVMAARAVCQPVWPLPPGVRVWDALSRRWGVIAADTEVNGRPLGEQDVAVQLGAAVIVRAHRGALLRPADAPSFEVVAAHA